MVRRSARRGLALLASVADQDEKNASPPPPPPPPLAPPPPTPHRRARGKYAPLSESQRAQLVHTYSNEGVTVPELIAALPFPVKKRTAYSILATYEKEGRVSKKPRGGSRKAYTPAEQQILVQVQDDHPSYTYDQLRKEWRKRSGTSRRMGDGTINRILKGSSFSTKSLYYLPAERNSPANIKKRQEYSQIAINWDHDNLLFLDETGFNLHLRRGRGRSRKGRRAYITRPANKKGNISALAALSPTQGLVKYEVRDGAFDGEAYADFVRELLRDLPCSYVIVQDGARTHRTKDVKEVFEECKITHEQVILPPYSPQLNPIESAFSKWKAYIKRQELSTQTHLRTLIREGADTITASDARGWYAHTIKYYVHCAAGKPLDEKYNPATVE